MYWAQNFKKEEIKELIIASICVGFIAHLFLHMGFRDWVLNWGAATLIAGFSYVIHEIAHKIWAEKLSFSAEFKLDWKLLLASLFISTFSSMLGMGILMIMMGGVHIKKLPSSVLNKEYHNITKEEEGKIAFMGPASNVLLAVFFKFLEPLSPAFSAGVYLNLLLALYNTMPFPSLDGLRIFYWSIIPWLSLLLSEIIMIVLIGWVPFELIFPLLIVIWIFLFFWLQKCTKAPY